MMLEITSYRSGVHSLSLDLSPLFGNRPTVTAVASVLPQVNRDEATLTRFG